MKTTQHNNRTSVSFNLFAHGNAYAERANKIHEISKKHNAQSNIFRNTSPYIYSKDGQIIGFQMGEMGGTVTFHDHSCNHEQAANELICLLESYGLVNEYYHEIVRTHREKDGKEYKEPQSFIVKK